MSKKTKDKWYAGGLHFECQQCGDCCSGPEEGVIWVTKHEVKLIADYLKISVDELDRRFLKRIGIRRSIIEEPITKDCIFLNKFNGVKRCGIYDVRPNQCRTWPFWSSNLESPDSWNEAGQRCPGINRGKLHTFEEIEAKRCQKKWWDDEGK